MNKILNAQEVTVELLTALQAEAKKYMSALGCNIRNNATVPEVYVLTFEEAVKQAREEGIRDSEESLKARFDSLEACYSAADHAVYLKDTTVITESLLVHELVHSLQNEDALIEAGRDCSDTLRLNTWFEAEAYTIQGLYEAKALETFLAQARKMNVLPYQLLQLNWKEKGRDAIEALVFEQKHEKIKAEIEDEQVALRNEIEEKRNSYEETRTFVEEASESLANSFLAIGSAFR